jgi:hypothetical protein
MWHICKTSKEIEMRAIISHFWFFRIYVLHVPQFYGSFRIQERKSLENNDMTEKLTTRVTKDTVVK